MICMLFLYAWAVCSYRIGKEKRSRLFLDYVRAKKYCINLIHAISRADRQQIDSIAFDRVFDSGPQAEEIPQILIFKTLRQT